MFNAIKGILQLIRLSNCLITFFVIIVGSFICSNENILTFKIFLAALAGFFVTAAGNTVNDIADVEIDKVNRPQRPLPSKKLSIQSAKILYVFLIVSSLVLSLLINYLAFLIILLSNMLLYLYSVTIKRLAFFGNITVSFLTGYTFIFAGMVVGNVKLALIPAVFAFLINLIREIIKDMEDIEGDKIANAKTLPIVYGFNLSKKLILSISLVLFILTLIPFVFSIYKIEFFIIVMVVVNPIIFYSVKLLYQDSSIKNLNKVSKLLKLSMVIGLISIYLGR